MKVVVFAQTPPPLHGQSYMVELLVRGFSENDYGIEVFHVNAQFATDNKDIGKFRVGKVFRLVGYCFNAIWLRFRHGARNLYYIPAPPVRVPVYRDWVILIFLRMFFRNVIFHWEAAGLGEWIEKQPRWMQRLTQLAHGGCELSIPLGQFNETEARILSPLRSVTVANGIPDPCPDFPRLQAARRERLRQRLAVWEGSQSRQPAPTVSIRVLYLSLCSKEKGLFDAVEGVCQANRLCRANHLAFSFELTIAGPFPDSDTEQRFQKTLERLGNPKTIQHVGFASGELKARLLDEADIFCFPTFYYAENLSLVLLEAMASGIPIVTTRWRSLPDLFPAGYAGLVEIQSPDEIASALFEVATRDYSDEFRQRFLENYTAEKFLANMAAAFKSLETTP